ncbi:DUF748 domain-containing protein [Malaciobacter marinus]|uniref:DUF748 domain-containing protein n=1 Tax=Malaciobacter marinus TaxID=505249 RepID=UPI003B0051D8
MKNNKFIKILIVVFALYSLLGFFVLPYFLKPKLQEVINQNITKQAFIQDLKFNPFTFETNVIGFEIKDKKNTLLSFDEFYIDFSLFKSIDKRHIRFEKVLLKNALVNIVENKDQTINLAKILKETKTNNNQEKEQSKENLINFLIRKAVIENATINFEKKSDIEPFSITLSELNYTFYDLGNFKNILASQTLRTKINKDTLLTIKGGFQIEPLSMHANVNLKGLKPSELIVYKKSMLNFDISDKTSLDLNFGYQLSFKDKFDLSIQDLNLNIKDFELIQEKNSLISFENFTINSLFLDYLKQEINIDSINLDKLKTNIISSKDEVINLTTLINQDNSKQENKKTQEKQYPWNIDLRSANISNTNINYEDLKTTNKLNLENLALTFEKFKLKNNNIFLKTASLKEPKVNFENKKEKLGISINNLNLDIQNLSKEKEKIQIDTINLDKKSLFLSDKLKNQIITKNIDLSIKNFNFNNKTLSIEKSILKNPYISIVLPKKDKAKEVKKVVAKNSKNVETKNSLNMQIGPFNIKNASLNFEDKNLPIPFKTLVSKLNGKFSEFSTTSSKPTKLKLEGKVDKYGYTKITGLVNHQNIKELTDVNLLFKNIAIKNFTPYSGKFIGKEIETGKLNLDLKYNIKKSNLDAKNSIIISDIKFGDEVKSEDAVSLPLDLAIALLEDADGIIDLDIPISGNVDDPKFAIAPIVWKAFTNLIVKAVSAPFSFLASLLGIEADEIKSIDFHFADAKILPSEKEALDNIAKIMNKRPNIAIKINPSFTQEDINKLKELKAEENIEKTMKEFKKGDKYQLAIEKIYLSYKNSKKLKELKKEFIIKEKKKEIFQKDAYLNYIKNIIVSKQVISDDTLFNLTKLRIENINKYLINKKQIKQNRVIIKKTDKTNTSKSFTSFDLQIDVAK